MIIDTTGVDVGVEQLYLHSFNSLDPAQITLKIDIISIEITAYIRDDELPEVVSVRKDETLVVIVPNVYSSIPISLSLLVNVRQPAGDLDLTFVSITELSSRSDIFIDATDLEPYSTHELILESYNALSEDEATLKTDIIEIIIELKACDILQEDLDAFASLYNS